MLKESGAGFPADLPENSDAWVKCEKFGSALMLASLIEKPGKLSPVVSALKTPSFYQCSCF